MKVDFESHRIITGRKIINLTTTQNNILELLYNKKNSVVKYEEIAQRIYNLPADDELKNVIRKHISLLNKRIKKYIKIKNIRSVGYIMEGSFNECKHRK